VAGVPSYPVTLSRPDVPAPAVPRAGNAQATRTSPADPQPATSPSGLGATDTADLSATSKADPGAAKPKGKRKVNTSAKGTGIELAAIKVLEAEGYKVHRCVRTGVKRGPFYFSQSNDVFGCIDLVAKKRGTRTRWIQVTAHSGIGQKKKDLDEVPWDPAHDSVEIWRWVGGQNRKHKATGAFLERQYFQVYHLDHGYALRKDDRVLLNPPAPTPGGTAT
jgi:hypothetical protein